jgi:hypothetical protein
MVTKKKSDKKDDVSLPSMPDAYHKARRQLNLFSAILIFWEYVGIRIGEKAAEDVSSKIPSLDIKVRLENPEVIPLVIAAIVLYFAFRLSIEWNQSSPRRRAQWASKIDLTVSYIIAAVALVLFLFQKKFTIRVAEFLDVSTISSALLGALLGAGFWWGFSNRKRESIAIRIFAVALLIFVSLVLFIFGGAAKTSPDVVWLFIGFFVILSISFIRNYHIKIRNWFRRFVK